MFSVGNSTTQLTQSSRYNRVKTCPACLLGLVCNCTLLESWHMQEVQNQLSCGNPMKFWGFFSDWNSCRILTYNQLGLQIICCWQSHYIMVLAVANPFNLMGYLHCCCKPIAFVKKRVGNSKLFANSTSQVLSRIKQNLKLRELSQRWKNELMGKYHLFPYLNAHNFHCRKNNFKLSWNVTIFDHCVVSCNRLDSLVSLFF